MFEKVSLEELFDNVRREEQLIRLLGPEFAEWFNEQKEEQRRLLEQLADILVEIYIDQEDQKAKRLAGINKLRKS